jgi:hypothetical protein
MKRISDSSQRAMVALAFVLEFYKVVMGSMLTVFVPQRCAAGAGVDAGAACSIVEVLQEVGESHTSRAAFFMNAATLVLMVVLYGFEAYREDWCISNLDIDPSKPAVQLEQELEAWPELRATGTLLNRRYSRMSGIVAGAVAGNFALSGVYLLGRQAGLSTLVSLLSYLLLLAMKLAQTYRISHASLREGRAYSAYMVTQRTFNCVDEDLVAARAKRELELALTPGAAQPRLADFSVVVPS